MNCIIKITQANVGKYIVGTPEVSLCFDFHGYLN